MKYEIVFWDWNGTIVDDLDIAVKSLNSVLEKYGYDKITAEIYRKNIDTSVINLYKKIFDLNVHPFEILANDFGHYYNLYSEDLSLHEGVLDKLQEFKEQGSRQVILSSSATGVIEQYMNRFMICEYFDKILGADDMLSGDKVCRAKRYIENYNLSKSKILFIGDTVYDSNMAKTLGADCALLTCGHQSPELLKRCRDSIFENLYQINC